MKKGDGFLVVGSSTVDILAKTSDVERVDIAGKHVERLVCISFASKSELQGVELHPGGSGSNSAIMMRALGSRVFLLSAVGGDEFGRVVLSDLKKFGVNSSLVRVFGGESTGVGIVIISSGGEKSILVYRGANSRLGPSDISDAAVRNSEVVFVASLVSSRNYQLFKKVLSLSRKHRKPVVFAPSITMLHAWMPELGKLKPHFDIAIMNYEEGSYYTGKSDIKDILGALPARVAVVMKDAEGAYAREGRKFFHVPAVPVRVLDTTGAGDAFSGAFAQSFFSTKSVTTALKTAAAAAALKLTHRGAHFDKTRAGLSAFMKRNASRLVVRRV
ncbi:hypothetical protein HYU18_03470 [Candidatus Woesearchaeota archaeon]|nr:hypothetical protein [Candidatus Woesearchaeota archaeon]